MVQMDPYQDDITPIVAQVPVAIMNTFEDGGPLIPMASLEEHHAVVDPNAYQQKKDLKSHPSLGNFHFPSMLGHKHPNKSVEDHEKFFEETDITTNGGSKVQALSPVGHEAHRRPSLPRWARRLSFKSGDIEDHPEASSLWCPTESGSDGRHFTPGLHPLQAPIEDSDGKESHYHTYNYAPPPGTGPKNLPFGEAAADLPAPEVASQKRHFGIRDIHVPFYHHERRGSLSDSGPTIRGNEEASKH